MPLSNVHHELSATSSRDTYKHETRIDIALLFSALFFQRFSLPLHNTFLMLDMVPVILIIFHQFLSGRLVIQIDRLMWYLAAGLAATCSLLLNFKSTMLSSYFLFLALYSLVILTRRSTSGQYRSTLQGFQFLVAALSFLAFAQFVAQFVIDPRKLIMFYGILPDFLFGQLYNHGMNTIHPIEGSVLLKSNGLFLAEPSNLSQITALAIIIEVIEFRRPTYLFLFAMGFLTAYSGVGALVLIIFLPLAALRDGRAGLAVMFVILAAVGIVATGLIDSSVFLSRVGEFENTKTSGFARFVSPWWLLGTHLETASPQTLLLGNGPGTIKAASFYSRWYGNDPSGWLKWFYEYGAIGSFVFVCFCTSCLRGSRCPGLVLAALIFLAVFAAGFLTSWFLTIIITLCTLQGAQAHRGKFNAESRYPQPLSSRTAG